MVVMQDNRVVLYIGEHLTVMVITAVTTILTECVVSVADVITDQTAEHQDVQVLFGHSVRVVLVIGNYYFIIQAVSTIQLVGLQTLNNKVMHVIQNGHVVLKAD
jgi:hypothetical protein